MRPSHLYRLLALPLLANAGNLVQRADGDLATATAGDAVTASSTSKAHATAAGGKLDGDLSTTTDGGAAAGTVFNGKTVPPITELGADMDTAIKDGYWMVEFFSPYCSHCKYFAPIWQTVYEFYYTSDPVPQSAGSGQPHNDLNSFTRYYDYNFAKIDCVANGDACSIKVQSFPTIVLYKDGKEVEKKVGSREVPAMSEWIESVLETIKPGSRVKGGPNLPKVGDHAVEGAIIAAAGAALGKVAEIPAAIVPGKANAKSTISATRVAMLPQATPNVMGKSEELSAESFQRLVTATREPWFVMFYAPWCGHCKALKPVWQSMARQMKGQMNIGQVNCDVEKRLCKDARVHGYPTLMFFHGGERIEYNGLRGLGDLTSFTTKAIAVRDGVADVDAASFEALEQKEEVIFLYFYDHATTTEDFEALERLVLSLVGHAKLVKTKDPALSERYKISTWPRLLVSRDGKPSYYHALSPRDMRDSRMVLDWMQAHWLPIVPELTASNAHEIMNGKLVVLGILSRDRKEDFAVAKREIKNAALEWIDKQTQAYKLERQELRDAKQLRIEEAEDRNDQRALRAAKSIRINMDDVERKEVGFAWVDAVFWERWIKTTFGISVAEGGEKVVINDEDNHRYWDITSTGNPIVPSRTSILETLPRIVANPPKISPKSTTTPLGHVWWVVKGQLFEHPIVSICVFLGMLVAAAIYGRQHLPACMNNGVFIKLGSGEKGSGGMNGLLGGNSGSASQGKVD